MKFAVAICILAVTTAWAVEDGQGEVHYQTFTTEEPEAISCGMDTSGSVEGGKYSEEGGDMMVALSGAERCGEYEQSCPLEGVVRCLRACLSINHVNYKPTTENSSMPQADGGEGSWGGANTSFTPESGLKVDGSEKGDNTVIFAGGAFVRNGGLKFKTHSVALGEFIAETGGVTPPGNGDFFILHREGTAKMIDSNDVNFKLKNGDFVFAAERLARPK